MIKTNLTRKDIYISWLILVTFYLYQYVLRVSPGVLIEEIRQDFTMNADQFSLIGSLYYYGYSLMQIPLGILIDRLGVRITVLYSLVLCIMGTLMLVIADAPFIAYIGRFISGVGAAVALMSALKIASDYLPASKQAVLIGACLTFGAIGALMTGEPLNYLLDQFSTWQMSFMVFASVGLIILALAFIYLPKVKKEVDIHEFESSNIKHDFLKIITNKKIIIYTIVTIGLYAPLMVMADLWGTGFLMSKFNMSRAVAGPVLMNIYIGMAIGSIVLPYLAQKYNLIDKVIVYSILTLLVLFSVVVYGSNLSHGNIVVLLLLIGFFCGAEMLCFTGALRHTNAHTSGLTIGVMNTFNMLSGAVLQQAIGSYLDYTWQGQLDAKGLRLYSTENFIEAFSILVAIISFASVVAIFTILRKNIKLK